MAGEAKPSEVVKAGIGIAAFPLDAPRDLFVFAERCERLGIDSLWQTDRLQGDVPQLEALATMAALAGATSRIKFGMNAVVASLRDPLVLAKQCATIDFLSGGRLLPVFGVGVEADPVWKATGRDPAARGRRADEALEIAQRLWRGEEVHFAGASSRTRVRASRRSPCSSRSRAGSGGAARPRSVAPRGSARAGSRGSPRPRRWRA
jgi:alkanesulfonate monooxygenase SsuD/methylene tetrahydromethanopterin reductase-like flavin-dependent oxidoreductase (luciferase family)